MTVADPDETWKRLALSATVLTRAHALADPHYPAYFDLFDAVIQFEPRLAARVKAHEDVA